MNKVLFILLHLANNLLRYPSIKESITNIMNGKIIFWSIAVGLGGLLFGLYVAVISVQNKPFKNYGVLPIGNMELLLQWHCTELHLVLHLEIFPLIKSVRKH